jgi:hypothetical protein
MDKLAGKGSYPGNHYQNLTLTEFTNTRKPYSVTGYITVMRVTLKPKKNQFQIKYVLEELGLCCCL